MCHHSEEEPLHPTFTIPARGENAEGEATCREKTGGRIHLSAKDSPACTSFANCSLPPRHQAPMLRLPPLPLSARSPVLRSSFSSFRCTPYVHEMYTVCTHYLPQSVCAYKLTTTAAAGRREHRGTGALGQAPQEGPPRRECRHAPEKDEEDAGAARDLPKVLRLFPTSPFTLQLFFGFAVENSEDGRKWEGTSTDEEKEGESGGRVQQKKNGVAGKQAVEGRHRHAYMSRLPPRKEIERPPFFRKSPNIPMCGACADTQRPERAVSVSFLFIF